MNRFETKLNSYTRSLNSLEEKLNRKEQNDDSYKAILYDFNGTGEQGWKLIKYYLEFVQGYDTIEGSKKVIRSGVDDGLYSDDQCSKLIDIINFRNLLSHEYENQDFEKWTENIKNYTDVLDMLLDIFLEIKNKYKFLLDEDKID